MRDEDSGSSPYHLSGKFCQYKLSSWKPIVEKNQDRRLPSDRFYVF